MIRHTCRSSIQQTNICLRTRLRTTYGWLIVLPESCTTSWYIPAAIRKQMNRSLSVSTSPAFVSTCSHSHALLLVHRVASSGISATRYWLD